VEHRENFERLWNLASEKDKQLAIASYSKYQRITYQIAGKHGFPGVVGAAVFAALSPNNDFWGNLRDTDELLRAAQAGLSLDQFSVSTYGNNKRKAWRIVHGEDPDVLIVALKTRNFFHNITEPDNPNWVTVDGHMYNIFTGIRRRIQSRNPAERVVKVTTKEYVIIATAVKDYAAEKGLVPCAMQGVLWQTWRRLHRIRSSPQLDLWDRDYLEARLGFVACS